MTSKYHSEIIKKCIYKELKYHLKIFLLTLNCSKSSGKDYIRTFKRKIIAYAKTKINTKIEKKIHIYYTVQIILDSIKVSKNTKIMQI